MAAPTRHEAMSTSPENDDTGGPALGLGDTFLTNKPGESEALRGRRLVIGLDDGGEIVVDLRERMHGVDSSGSTSGRPEHVYEVFEVAENLYFLRAQAVLDGCRSRSVILDLEDGRALAIDSKIGETKVPGEPKVGQRFRHGALVDSPSDTRFTPSRELVGRRIMWAYSPTDVYEHIYLNENWYVWHCLAGEEFQQAEVDPCVMYGIRDDVHLLAFGERALPIGAVMVLNLSTMRSYASMLGEEGGSLSAFAFGAIGTEISDSRFPEPYEPRLAPPRP
ncbi:MoaF C-terminal domain-containing protein [Streptomyces sp. NPDC091280]|uniref:MoaF C-terminal domain-containing protein n=1 Tax=Streptomyces sp. NPDC091280 TaxID=3365984 RepID=UPI003827E080